jgi:16S rRNA processing protein RimM
VRKVLVSPAADEAARRWHQWALVGRIARSHGNRGEVIVDPYTDFPERRFAPGAAVCVGRAGQVESFRVRSMRIHRGRPIVGLDGVDSINAAERLATAEIRVPLEDLTPLPDGVFYRHDLVGCAVETVAGLQVGVVSAVEGSDAGSRLVVGEGHAEVLVPLAAPICVSIDVPARKIVIDPPAGLLDLNR